VKATVDYPRATLEVKEVVVPGARMAAARVEVSALNSKAPAASVTANFEPIFVAANRALKFASPERLSGVAAGELSVQAR